MDIKFILLTKVKKSKLWAYYPANISKSHIAHAKSLSVCFRNQEMGQIQTKNENYFYATYTYPGSSDKFFLFLVAGTKYEPKDADKFFAALFEGFKIESINPADSILSLNSNVKNILAQTFNTYSGNKGGDSIQKEKEIVIEMQDIKEEKEVKKKSEKGVLDESTAKNRLIGSEEEINDEPEFDENAVGIQDNVFVKDPSQLQKVNWWRRMKMIFIVICIILAIGLYVSIPFLMKYRDKFSVLTNNSTKTVRLLRINSNDTE